METKETFAKALTEILVGLKAITPDLARGMEDAFGRSSEEEFDNFILQEGFVNREQLLEALATYYKVPAIDVTGEFFDSLLLRNFPLDFLVRNAIIPMQEDENMLVVVAAEPEREGLESAIRTFSRFDVLYRVGLRQDIIDAAREYYDKAVNEVPEDQDLHTEHNEEMDAYGKVLKEEGEQIEVEDEDDTLSDEDSIR